MFLGVTLRENHKKTAFYFSIGKNKNQFSGWSKRGDWKGISQKKCLKSIVQYGATV